MAENLPNVSCALKQDIQVGHAYKVPTYKKYTTRNACQKQSKTSSFEQNLFPAKEAEHQITELLNTSLKYFATILKERDYLIEKIARCPSRIHNLNIPGETMTKA